MAVFVHDNRIPSALITRASADRQLAALRSQAAFEAAARAVPALAAWTDPGRSRAITSVLPGGRLYNSYRGQLNHAGRVALGGLIYAGDAVCTTNPALGRGVTTSLLQARRLIWSPISVTGPCGYRSAKPQPQLPDTEEGASTPTREARSPRRVRER